MKQVFVLCCFTLPFNLTNKDQNSIKSIMASIFTRIINGELPCYKIAEDAHHFAFLDINPMSKGHTLVVPKEEIDYLFDLENERLKSLMCFAKEIAHGIDRSLGTVRTGVIVEGLEVPHAHVHLIPIYAGKKSFNFSNRPKFSKEEMEAIAASIRGGLS